MLPLHNQNENPEMMNMLRTMKSEIEVLKSRASLEDSTRSLRIDELDIVARTVWDKVFHAKSNADQTIASGAPDAPTLYQTEIFVDDLFYSISSGIVTIKYPGRYQISATITRLTTINTVAHLYDVTLSSSLQQIVPTQEGVVLNYFVEFGDSNHQFGIYCENSGGASDVVLASGKNALIIVKMLEYGRRSAS